jgi:hypothetical protein
VRWRLLSLAWLHLEWLEGFLGVGTAASALMIAVVASAEGALNKFRAYKIEKISDDKIIFKYIFPDVREVIAKELNLNETR